MLLLFKLLFDKTKLYPEPASALLHISGRIAQIYENVILKHFNKQIPKIRDIGKDQSL